MTRFAIQQDLAAGIGNKAGDHVEDGGLAAAGRTDHRNELALLDIERDVMNSRHMRTRVRVEVGLCQIAE